MRQGGRSFTMCLNLSILVLFSVSESELKWRKALNLLIVSKRMRLKKIKIGYTLKARPVSGQESSELECFLMRIRKCQRCVVFK
jgi:hypothetical protein